MTALLRDWTAKALREQASLLSGIREKMDSKRQKAREAAAAAEAEESDWDKIISAADTIIGAMAAEAAVKEEAEREAGQ